MLYEVITHTVCIGPTEYVLHLLPSGIFHEHITCVIGNGVVIDPSALMKEINQLKEAGIKIGNRLLISHNAHLIMPYHKQLDVIVITSYSIHYTKLYDL